jgi:hypothetical protein
MSETTKPPDSVRPFDGVSLGRQIVSAVKAYCSRQVDPLTKQVAELQTKVGLLEDRSLSFGGVFNRGISYEKNRFETKWNFAGRRTLPRLPICQANVLTRCTSGARRSGSCSIQRKPDLRRAGRQRLQRPFRMHVLSPAVRVQPVR